MYLATRADQPGWDHFHRAAQSVFRVVARSSARARHLLALVNATLILAVELRPPCAARFSVWDAYQRNLAMVGIIEVPRWVVVSPIFVGSVLLCIERVAFTYNKQPVEWRMSYDNTARHHYFDELN